MLNLKIFHKGKCVFLLTFPIFKPSSSVWETEQHITKYCNSSFGLWWYVLLQQNRRNNFYPWLWVTPLAAETVISHPSLLSLDPLRVFLLPTFCKWDSSLSFATAKKLGSLLRTAGLPSKCPYLEIRPAHGSSLGGWGRVCWGFLNTSVLFSIEVPWGHVLLDFLSEHQHLVAEDTKGTAT